MDNGIALNGEKKFAVIKFHADETYSTCAQKNKAADSAGYFVGEEVTIQWSKHKAYKGIVVFTDGKQFQLNFLYSLYPTNLLINSFSARMLKLIVELLRPKLWPLNSRKNNLCGRKILVYVLKRP